LLVFAAVFRTMDLDSPGYGMDQVWTNEVATGRAWMHLHLPTNQLLQAPEFVIDYRGLQRKFRKCGKVWFSSR
jgi:hypothetical protein